MIGSELHVAVKRLAPGLWLAYATDSDNALEALADGGSPWRAVGRAVGRYEVASSVATGDRNRAEVVASMIPKRESDQSLRTFGYTHPDIPGREPIPVGAVCAGCGDMIRSTDVGVTMVTIEADEHTKPSECAASRHAWHFVCVVRVFGVPPTDYYESEEQHGEQEQASPSRSVRDRVRRR